mmetsp:Transcript_36500/g.73218  ORF Transcript_36500/g.73218 Transcript_36500/m.73218 type:complete len:173 (-) Transcript_36500:189-707(-)
MSDDDDGYMLGSSRRRQEHEQVLPLLRSTEEFVYGTAPNDFLKEQMDKLPLPTKGKCLMLAEGEGRNAVALAERGYTVTGVDISSVGLKKAEKLAALRNVHLETVVANLGDFDFGSEKWDLVVGIFCHLPPPIRSQVLPRFQDRSNQGEWCCLSATFPSNSSSRRAGLHPKI